MKYYIKWWLGLGIAGLIASCEQKGVEMYEENPGLSFKTAQSSFSFIGKQDVLTDTLNVTVVITGEARDYDRLIKAEAIADSTTAYPEQYRLLDGVIKKGEFQGTLPVVLNYSKELDTIVKELSIRLVETADFKEVRLGLTIFHIQFSAKVMKPDNWDPWLSRWYFSNYSDSWYRFILKVVGRTSIPCWPQNCPEPEKYPMTAMEATALKNKVKMALTEYNNTHDDVLRHEDGEWKGQAVTMP